jgi:hypothetical protein
MSMLIFLVFWGAIAFYFYRRFKRQWARNHSPGEKFQLAPATAAGIVGLLALIPGLWILRVEGWRETWSTNLATGETTTTSTFWDQFSRAAVYFAIGGALMYASKVMAERQTPWPSPIQQQLVRLGLLPYSDPYPSAPARRQASSESQFHAPPGWPVPPHGWTPTHQWRPDPTWPPAPPGWQFWPHEPRSAD